MKQLKLSELKVLELAPGYRANVIHGDSMTVTHVEVEPGSALPTHSHPHEQIVNMIEGEFELTVDGEPLQLTPGSVVLIPSNVPHSGLSHTKCRIIDVFHPVREDMKV